MSGEDKQMAEGLARAKKAVLEMSLSMQEASEAIRKAYAEAARKINAAVTKR